MSCFLSDQAVIDFFPGYEELPLLEKSLDSPVPIRAKVFAINTPPPPALPFGSNDADYSFTVEQGVQTSYSGDTIRCPRCSAMFSVIEAPLEPHDEESQRGSTETDDGESVSSSGLRRRVHGYRDSSAASEVRASLLIASMLNAAGVSPTSNSSGSVDLACTSDSEDASNDCAQPRCTGSETISIILPDRVPRSKRTRPGKASQGHHIVLPERRMRRQAKLETDSLGLGPWLGFDSLSAALQRFLHGFTRLELTGSK